MSVRKTPSRDKGRTRPVELIDFSWQVAKEYQLIDDRDSAGYLEASSDTVRDYVPLYEKRPPKRIPKGEWRRPPVIDSALFLDFADTPTTREGVLRFAREHGLLGINRWYQVLARPGRWPVYLREPVDDWYAEIKAMKLVVAATGLRSLVREPVARDSLAGYQRLINDRLRDHASPALLWHSDDGAYRLLVRPANLLGALWLQLARALDTTAEYRRCPSCAQWYAVGEGGRYRNAQSCSEACRKRRSRLRLAVPHIGPVASSPTVLGSRSQA